MDLNYLLSRHQVLLMRAENAACGEAMAAHRDLARAYAAQIRALQTRLAAGALLPASA